MENNFWLTAVQRPLTAEKERKWKDMLRGSILIQRMKRQQICNYHHRLPTQPYLCDEVRVGQEQLFSHVHNGEESRQLVFQLGFRELGDQRAVLWCCGCALGLGINTGSAGLWGRRCEREHDPEESREIGKKASGPVGVAEERTRGQHGVGKHSWTMVACAINRWLSINIHSVSLQTNRP